MGQHLKTDPVTGHMLLVPSPTCMKGISEPECGHCVFIVSGKEMLLGENEGHWLNGKKWSEVRAKSIYLPAKESYAPLSTYVINACKKMNCNDEVEKFKVKLGTLKEVSP